MCRLCKQNFTPEQTIAQLKESLVQLDRDPNFFELWNTTSLAFVLYSAIGIDGTEARDLGLKLLGEFNNWVAIQPAYYLPKTGVEPMLHPNVINKLYLWAENFTNPLNLSRDELFDFLKRKINEYKKEQSNYELWSGIGAGIGVGLIATVGFFFAIKYKCPLVGRFKSFH